jgi:PadR family transcriptional regulator, regulatory protein PadR
MAAGRGDGSDPHAFQGAPSLVTPGRAEGPPPILRPSSAASGTTRREAIPSPDCRIGSYLPIIEDMRRRTGELLPIELAILVGGIEFAAAGEPGFYGFAMARQIRHGSAAKQLTAYGTLYKALARLERAGMLTSSWEDPGIAESEGRPRRRLYRVTPSGEQAVARSPVQRASTGPHTQLGLAPS